MPLCILCRERKATVPDRETMGRVINRVCHECHVARLRGDLAKILEAHDRKTRRSTPNA